MSSETLSFFIGRWMWKHPSSVKLCMAKLKHPTRKMHLSVEGDFTVQRFILLGHWKLQSSVILLKSNSIKAMFLWDFRQKYINSKPACVPYSIIFFWHTGSLRREYLQNLFFIDFHCEGCEGNKFKAIMRTSVHLCPLPSCEALCSKPVYSESFMNKIWLYFLPAEAARKHIGRLCFPSDWQLGKRFIHYLYSDTIALFWCLFGSFVLEETHQTVENVNILCIQPASWWSLYLHPFLFPWSGRSVCLKCFIL